MGLVGKYTRVIRTGALALGVVGAVSFGTSASAGVLDGHALAFNDGNGPIASGGAWTSTTAFDNRSGLSGTIDWTVFGPGDFPYAGYVPTAGELTYAFQIFGTGTDAIHSFTLNDINGRMDNIGSFADLTGEAPISVALGTQAQWNFSGLDAGENSIGLAFSSFRDPDTFLGVVVNGGTFAVTIPLPVPGANDLTPTGFFVGLPGTIPAFTRTQLFDDSFSDFTVSASVDYAVFKPGAFGVSFPGQDPSGGADYVYAYQIENRNVQSTDISKFTVGLDGDEPLGTIGFISGEGLVDPSASLFVGDGPTSAAWDFDPGQFTDAADSAILFFTSAAAPELDTATVTAAWASTHNLPSPLPEPATLSLFALAAGVTSLGRRRRM